MFDKPVNLLSADDEECLILLVEKKQTLHTGNKVTEKTKSIEDQLK